jgi:lambda repressor-like predicted transcriptional regulator
MANLRDIYSAIVDLARRGYMKIIETSAKGRSAFGGKQNDFSFEKQKDWNKAKDIQPFEKTLLSAIFESGDRVALADLDLHDTFETVKKEIYDSLVTDGFFPENPQKVRTKYYVLAGFAFFTGNIFLCIVAAVFGTIMPRKTLFGAGAAAVARSLKNFLVSQDKELAFQAKNQMMFEKLLPYAVAFGVEEIWAARFKDIALKQPTWYVSPSGSAFNAMIFANSIGRAASVSFASSIASRSSTGFSSGFGGGGFSGGGGGGGGGGSW